MRSERSPFHFAVTADNHCFRVTLTHLGISHRMSFSRHAYMSASEAERGAILRNWRDDIRHQARLMRAGRYGLREYAYPHPRQNWSPA